MLIKANVSVARKERSGLRGFINTISTRIHFGEEVPQSTSFLAGYDDF